MADPTSRKQIRVEATIVALVGGLILGVAYLHTRSTWETRFHAEMFQCLMDRRDEDTTTTVADAYRRCVPPPGLAWRVEDVRRLAGERRAKAGRRHVWGGP